MREKTMQQVESSVLSRPLSALTALVTRFPVTTMIVAGLLAAVSMVMAQNRLKFKTSRADLLDPNSEYNRHWLEYTKEFGQQEDVLVVVRGNDRNSVTSVLDKLAGELQKDTKHFRAVFYKIDQAKLQAKGLYYLEPQQLQEVEALLNQAQPVLQGNWDSLSVGGQIAWFSRLLQQGDPRKFQASAQSSQQNPSQALTILSAALSETGTYRSPWPEMPRPSTVVQSEAMKDGYLLSDKDRVGMLLLWLVKEKNDNFAEYSESVNILRDIVARTKQQIKDQYPGTAIGLTGLPILENDEMESSESTMTKAGVLSLIGVTLIYVAGFGCFRHPFMATIALLVPMAWSFGYITMAVGHLNILSSAFGTIVIGLGSDFGVYHVAQYMRLRGQSFSTRDALLETARSVGPGITTGALSTALAFFVIGLTEFPGIAELGIVAGGGIILCWIAALTVLPAMIQWSDNKWQAVRVPPPLDVYVWLKPIMSRPWLMLATFMTGTVLIAFGIGRLWYDHNLLNLQAEGLESVELEKQLIEHKNLNASFAISVAKTREEVVARTEKFKKLPLVDRVREIATSMPENVSAKSAMIYRIHNRLTNLPHSVPSIPVTPPGDLQQTLAYLQQFMVAGGRTADAQSIQQIIRLIASLSEQQYYRRIEAFQQAMGADILGKLCALRDAAGLEPPQLNDLPEGLVSRFVGRSGCYVMQIYSKADIWNMEAMEQFVQQVRSVDKDATGNPIQVYESSRAMKRSYEKAAWYALITVVAIVWLDFRSVENTLLALLPLGLAVLQLFGLMGLLNIPLNPANMIVLPLILGVGVDIGVHVVHDYLREPAPYRISGSTAAAIVINTVMNIVGFGSLMVASHRGLYSLGRVLTLGMTCVLISGLVMPSLLRLLQAIRSVKQTTKTDENPTADQELIESPECIAYKEPELRPIRRRLAA